MNVFIVHEIGLIAEPSSLVEGVDGVGRGGGLYYDYYYYY